MLAIDGSKFAAVNARDQNFNAAKLQELIARADARLAEYLAQLDSADAAEPGTAALGPGAELAAKIAALREKQDWHKELLAQLQDGEAETGVGDRSGHAQDAHGARDDRGLQRANGGG